MHSVHPRDYTYINIIDHWSFIITKLQLFYRGRSLSIPLGEDYRYNMSHARRGMALIFNNKNFRRHTDIAKREGTDADAENLERTFTRLGFNVKRCDNLTSALMLMEMRTGLAFNYRHLFDGEEWEWECEWEGEGEGSTKRCVTLYVCKLDILAE